MKVALIGSAPSSVDKAPFSDPSWEIWGCSPGAYSRCPRVTCWFEIHRWEPPTLGRPADQVPWLSPEYCAWMATQPQVYMTVPVPEIPNSVALPAEALTRIYGSYFFTSTIAWMFAVALEKMRAEPGPHAIGLWGIDMAADEEYGYQRAGCQYFIQLAKSMGVEVLLPPESDLMRPPPLYGVSESTHSSVKLTARRKELTTRLAAAQAALAQRTQETAFLQGALDDLTYHERTWMGPQHHVADFRALMVPQPAAIAVRDEGPRMPPPEAVHRTFLSSQSQPKETKAS